MPVNKDLLKEFKKVIDLLPPDVKTDFDDADDGLENLLSLEGRGNTLLNLLIIVLLIIILKLLLNKRFGLKEIKREIQGIEDRLDHPKFGLKEIKLEIKEIEKKLDKLLPKKKRDDE